MVTDHIGHMYLRILRAASILALLIISNAVWHNTTPAKRAHQNIHLKTAPGSWSGPKVT